MASTQEARSPDPEADHGRRKRTQVLSQAYKVHLQKGFESVGVFLGARLDKGILANILDDMDTELLRSWAAGSVDDTHLHERSEHMKLAMDALKDLSTVLKALNAVHRTGKYPRLAPLVDQCLEMVHERWSGVASCIMFLAQTIFPSDPEWADVMPACLSVMEPLVYQPEKNHFQQDIVTMPATVDVLFHFLRLTDAQTGKPTTLPFKQGSDCLIAKIFASFVRSEIGATSLSSRLECLPQDTRREVVRAFVRRFQDVLAKSRDEPNQRSDIGQTLFSLIRATCGLLTPMAPGDEYAHRKLIFEATRTLSRFTEDAALKKLARLDPTILNTCVNDLCSLARKKGMSARVMERLFEGGMASCLLRSLPYAATGAHPWQGVRGQACDLIPFLTDSRCFTAAKKGGTNLQLFKEFEDQPKSTAFQSIYSAYSLALRCGESAFSARKDATQMCYNVQHQLPLQGSGNPPTLRTCGSCHAVFYCSRACQEEDWAALHKPECKPASLYWRQKLKAAGVTRRVEQDRLTFLEALANRFLPAPSEMEAPHLVELEQSSKGTRERAKDTLVHVFDTAGMRNMLDRTNSLKFVKYEHMSISAFLKKYDEEVGESTQARIFQCAEDVQRHPDSSALVTGMFLASSRVVITICAKMRYTGGAVMGQKYRVVSHGCCVLTLIGL